VGRNESSQPTYEDWIFAGGRQVLRSLSRSERIIEFVGDRPGLDFRYSLHCIRILRLGWKLQVGFDERLPSTIDWYEVLLARKPGIYLISQSLLLPGDTILSRP